MKKCPLCGEAIEEWQALCKDCWEAALEAKKLKKLEDGELVKRLKGKAKSDLVEIMREICRNCKHFSKDVSNPVCDTCIYKEKEKLIHAFLE